MTVPIHVEVWVAAASLHRQGRAEFSSQELANAVRAMFGDTRPGVVTHITAHCCATAKASVGTPHNYLTRTARATYTLWRPGDSIHETRRGAPTWPAESDVPMEYRDLWQTFASNRPLPGRNVTPPIDVGPTGIVRPSRPITLPSRNRDLLTPALDELRKGLRPFVLREFRRAYGGEWRIKLHPYEFSSRGEEDIRLDVRGLLRILTDRWNEVFKSVLDGKARGYASELREIAKWEVAHLTTDDDLAAEDLDRALDTAVRLLTLVGAGVERETVQQLRRQVSSPAPVSPTPVKPDTRRHVSEAQRLAPSAVAAEAVLEAVGAFDQRYGEMEQALWQVALMAREDLLRGRASATVGTFVWTIKSWWAVQGVTKAIAPACARALAAQPWSESLFSTTVDLGHEAESKACDHVSNLVAALQQHGVTTRQEFSLASKVLHWLMPFRIPIYDSFVRKSLRIPESQPAVQAYRDIVAWEYATVRQLLAAGSAWVGTLAPQSPFRALDKYLWWFSGGPDQKAVTVSQPWRVVRALQADQDRVQET